MSSALPHPSPATVRVVCVVYHPGDELVTFARTLASASTAKVELVIVDNGADPTVAREVADEFGARLVASGTNLGYGGAANLGARGADAPWIVVANSDIEWHPGSLDALLAAGDGAPAAGAVGPAQLNTDGTVYPSARELPSLTQGAGHALFVRVWPGNPWTRRYQARQLEGTEFAVEDVPPSNPAPWEHGGVPGGRYFPPDAGLPARIVIYRRPVESRATDPFDLADLVRDVVVEQVAHMLGRSPEDVDPQYGDAH
jgi:glycosyltransferase involved in cell wall biosynthesis